MQGIEPQLESPKHLYSLVYVRDKVDESGCDVFDLLSNVVPEVRADKNIMMRAVVKNAKILKLGTDDIRNDPTIVKKAIKESSLHSGAEPFMFAGD